MGFNGINEDTYSRLIIDCGEVYQGFNGFSSLGTSLGCTRGGNQFTIEQEVREMEADGSRGPVEGSRRITRIKASLTCNFLEHTLAGFKRALVASSSATFETNWDAITRSAEIASTDYISNVTIVGDVSGLNGAMAIRLNNALSDGNFELAFTDKDEGVLAVTFTAHFDPANLTIEPWTIYWPNV